MEALGGSSSIPDTCYPSFLSPIEPFLCDRCVLLHDVVSIAHHVIRLRLYFPTRWRSFMLWWIWHRRTASSSVIILSQLIAYFLPVCCNKFMLFIFIASLAIEDQLFCNLMDCRRLHGCCCSQDKRSRLRWEDWKSLLFRTRHPLTSYSFLSTPLPSYSLTKTTLLPWLRCTAYVNKKSVHPCWC